MSHEDNGPPSIGKEMILSLTDEGSQAIACEYAELTIDAIFDSELVNTIPVVNSFMAFGKGAMALKETFFKRKVLKFLSATSGATNEEWKEYVTKLEEKHGGLERAGEFLIHSLSNVGDERKALYMGRLYAAAARQEISISLLYRMHMILEQIYLPDLDAIVPLQDYREFKFSLGGALLVSLQILIPTSEDFGEFYDQRLGATVLYSVTDLGKKMIHILELK